MGEKEMRILSKNQQYEIYTLLKHGVSQHQISKKLGVHRLTIRRYQRQSPCQEEYLLDIKQKIGIVKKQLFTNCKK